MLRDWCSADGIRIDHTDSEVDALFCFITDKKLCGFVELGMHEGGLALCIMKEMPRLNYLGVTSSYDIINDATKIKADKHKYTVILIGDTISSEVVTFISEWLADRWPVLIYCDGENKIAQLAMYRNLVRFGDFIGVHDYWNKNRRLPELPTYPYADKPKPEVYDTDLKYLKHDFQSVKFASLINTRIAILQRRTK